MKTLYALILLSIVSISSLSAQTDCNELEKQLADKQHIIKNQSSEIQQKNNTINILENTISDLKNDIQYYKETLHLINSKIEVTDKDVTFKINSIEGNSINNEVFINGVIINNGTTRSLQGKSFESIDPQGNVVKKFKIVLGESEGRIEKLYNEVPVKFSLTIPNFSNKAPMIKLLRVEFYSTPANSYRNDNLEIIFSNLNINWK